VGRVSEMRDLRSLEMLLQDLRFALRTLRKSPGFTGIAVLTLALGIGANTAVFSFIDAVLLNGLPYHEASRLIEFAVKNPQGEDDSVSPGDFTEWRGGTQSLESMSFVESEKFYTLTGIGDPDEVWGWPVSHNLFQMLGAHAALGRTFSSDDTQSVILSDHYWHSHFSANSKILGQVLSLDGKPFTVIGVMPPNFYFRIPAIDLWLPFSPTAQDAASHDQRSLAVVARLKDGFTLQQARAEFQAMQSRLASLYPDEERGWTVSLDRFHDPGLGEFQNIVLSLVGAVFFSLLIACSNVANMFLSRGTIRQRELAVRTALGASSSRLSRQLLTETLLVSVFSGLLGIVLAMAVMRFLVHLVPAFSPDGISGLQGVGLNLPVLSFASLLSLLTGLAVGLIPALRGPRLSPNEILKDTPSASSGPSKTRLQKIFLTAEVALTLILLVGAGLMIESFFRLTHVNAGFDPRSVLTVRVPLVSNKYAQGPKSILFYEELLDKIRAIPGVQSAALVNNLPLSGFSTMGYFELRGTSSEGPKQSVSVAMQAVSPGYFHTMRIALLRGRDFTTEDTKQGSPKVMILDESMARRYWPGKDLIGKSVFPDVSIVGIVADTRRESLHENPAPQSYVPYGQHPFASFLVTFVIRARNDPISLVPAVRTAVWSVDRDQPLIQIRTMRNVMEESLWRQHFSVTLLIILAGVALLLSAVGLYGVISYSVSQRTREIGVRVALGATPRDVLKLVVGQGVGWIFLGVIVGVAGAFALTRFLTRVLFEVKPSDPTVFVAVATLLIVVATIACYFPARRAMRIEPTVALRYE